jgi:outer membrane protein insertion porin family
MIGGLTKARHLLSAIFPTQTTGILGMRRFFTAIIVSISLFVSHAIAQEQAVSNASNTAEPLQPQTQPQTQPEQPPEQQFTADKINVTGIKRVEKETVTSYLEIKRGDVITRDKLNGSIKALYATGLFSDVWIRSTADVVDVKVEENPVIHDVAFEGNRRLEDDALQAEVGLRSRSVYTKAKVQNDVERLKDLYRKNGRFGVTVSPQVIAMENNQIDVVFEIEEGKKSEIRNIYFLGNENFSIPQLSSVISSKETRWYTFLSSTDVYDSDRVSFDEELLRRFYVSQGFADFRVLSSIAEVDPEQEAFSLTFSIEEGNIYQFGDISIDSKITDVDQAELQKLIETEKGEIFNAKLVDGTIDKLTEKLNDSGYAFVQVSADYNADKQNNIMNLSFEIKEGQKVYVNQINIRGNVRTLDKVIRREFRLQEGDPFNAAKIRRSRQRVQNLGFFDKVAVDRARTSDSDKVDINVDVEERPTGELNFGAGFSTVNGILGNVGVRERNLLGKGQDLRANFEQSTRGSSINVGFTEPYFLDREISAGFDIFDSTQTQANESSFDRQSRGITFRASYELTEHLRHLVRYSFNTVDVTDVQADASRFIREQEGENTTSLIGHAFTYDTRNNIQEPSSGLFGRLSQDLAGFGGNTKFLRHEVKGSYFYPVYKDDVIFSASLTGGNIMGIGDEDVAIAQRFFIGNQQIRGFDFSGIGPRDANTRDALGGNTYYIGVAELTFPLGLPEELGFRGAIFTDVGTLYGMDDTSAEINDSDALRVTSGIGLSWRSPLGPVRIDMSRALVKQTFDITEDVRFNFGTRF